MLSWKSKPTKKLNIEKSLAYFIKSLFRDDSLERKHLFHAEHSNRCSLHIPLYRVYLLTLNISWSEKILENWKVIFLTLCIPWAVTKGNIYN